MIIRPYSIHQDIKMFFNAAKAIAQAILGLAVLIAVPSIIWYLTSQVFVSDERRRDRAEMQMWERAYAECIWETGQFDGTEAFLYNHTVRYGRKGNVQLIHYDDKGLCKTESEGWYEAKGAGWDRFKYRISGLMEHWTGWGFDPITTGTILPYRSPNSPSKREINRSACSRRLPI